MEYIDCNVRSLAKWSPKSIKTLVKQDIDNICDKAKIDDSALFYTELQLFKIEIGEFEKIAAANAFTREQKSYIPLINQAHRYLLILPVTVVNVERLFRKLKIMKNSLRTLMEDERLQSL